MGAAADSSEASPDPLTTDALYASTLGTQYSMVEPENNMKWATIHPAQTTYNFGPGDELVTFAQAHQMQVRGHNLAWEVYNPAWVNTLAMTATPAAMSAVLQDHINTVVSHYKGQVFAWDVVNEAVSDSQTGTGTAMKDSIWYNQPGIGVTGTGYVEQALRWAHVADPNALLFYNDYNIEDQGAKFNAVYAMVKDFVTRGVPINGVGIQMHIDTGSYPSSAGFAKNIQMLNALGLQVHITEMDVRIPVDSSGNATAANLQAQAATYQRILTVCLQNPGCTAFQTWGFTDKHSWIPSSYPGFGDALPFDVNYQPKPAVTSLISTLQTVPPVLSSTAIVNAASYQGGAVAPGELVTIFQANLGPGTLVGAQLTSSGLVSSNLSGTQISFDGTAAPLIYALAGQVSAVVPYEVSGKQQTVVQYSYNGVVSNNVTLQGGSVRLRRFSRRTRVGQRARAGPEWRNDAQHGGESLRREAASLLCWLPEVERLWAERRMARSHLEQGIRTQPVLATIGGVTATVGYAGPAPGEVNGVMQVNITAPTGMTGAQPLVITVGGVGRSQSGVIGLRDGRCCRQANRRG